MTTYDDNQEFKRGFEAPLKGDEVARRHIARERFGMLMRAVEGTERSESVQQPATTVMNHLFAKRPVPEFVPTPVASEVVTEPVVYEKHDNVVPMRPTQAVQAPTLASDAPKSETKQLVQDIDDKRRLVDTAYEEQAGPERQDGNRAAQATVDYLFSRRAA